MKLVICCFVLSTALSSVVGGRGCLEYNRTCVQACPPGTHAYYSGCKDTYDRKTCDQPCPKYEGKICDLQRCDCDGCKVMDLRTGLCHLPHQCPNTPNVKALPEYTGHCPMLQFRYGNCYGESTRQIMREIRSTGIFEKPLQYRPEYQYEIENVAQRDMPFPDHYDDIKYREHRYVTGYTGYVPGMNFRYGKSYGRAADDSMADFSERQRDTRRRLDITKSYARSRSVPKMESVHTRDEVRRNMQEFAEINKFKDPDSMISPEFPPIAGYTGHIPRIKGSEASLSQRYHCAARRGLELIQMERENRHRLQNADENIRAILKSSEKKHSYWNWG